MKISPCPCMDLQKGVKILAIVDIILSCVVLVLSILSIASIFFIVVLIIAILQLLLAVALYYGATKRNYKLCKIWLIISIVLAIINGISLIVGVFTSSGGVSFAFSLIRTFYAIYEIVVVIHFMKELKEEGIQGNSSGLP